MSVPTASTSSSPGSPPTPSPRYVTSPAVWLSTCTAIRHPDLTGEAVCQLPARPAAAKINSAVPSPMWAVVQALQQRGRNVGHIRVLVDLAVHADPEARRLIREAGRHIGEVLAGAVNLLNPDALVITGDMAKAYDIFVAGLRETVYGNATAVATRERRGDPRTTDPALHPRRPIRRDRQRGDDSRPRSVCRSYGRFDLTDSYRIRHDGSDVVVFVALDPERSQGRRQCPYTRSVGLPHRRSPVQATAWRHAGIRALVIATRESIG